MSDLRALLKEVSPFVCIILLTLCSAGLLGYAVFQQITPDKSELFTYSDREMEAAQLYHRKCLRQGGAVIVSDYKYGIEIACIGAKR